MLPENEKHADKALIRHKQYLGIVRQQVKHPEFQARATQVVLDSHNVVRRRIVKGFHADELC